MTREFWLSHDSSGYRAKIIVEWSTPTDVPELPPERMAAAEEIAEEALAVLTRKPLDIVQAMLGRSRSI